jgi:hypothetical protein
VTDGLFWLFGAVSAPVAAARRSGMQAVQRLRPLKELLVERAMRG